DELAGLPVALAHGLVVAQREEGGCSVADGALGDALCTELVSHLPNEEAVWNGVRHTVDGIAAPGDGDDHGAGASALRGGGEGEAGADWGGIRAGQQTIIRPAPRWWLSRRARAPRSARRRPALLRTSSSPQSLHPSVTMPVYLQVKLNTL